MIVSASRRSDIPCFYSQWFLNRLKEGYVLVYNVRNKKKVFRIDLSLDKVDCIVFWTKNPINMFDKLDEIDSLGYKYFFHFTLNLYDSNIETNLVSKQKLITSFIRLSNKIGKDKVIWRYDPIFLDSKYTIEWHVKAFEKLCELLHQYTNRCVISFIDIYEKISQQYHEVSFEQMNKIAVSFSKIASKYKLELFTCAQEIDLSCYDIKHGACLEKEMIEDIIGYSIKNKKDKNQRKDCKCIESVDIGCYNTCFNGCSYCYANTRVKPIVTKDNAKILGPSLMGDEEIICKEIDSIKERQMKLF